VSSPDRQRILLGVAALQSGFDQAMKDLVR
jgi:hypothetical protein